MSEDKPAVAVKPKAPAKPSVKEGFKRVTTDADLRVVTKDFVVFQLSANTPKEVHEEWAFEAQRAAGDAKVGITVE